ncbi:HAD family hydrolase [Cohnella cellulosilytica]|uniref:HAD family hydrolase n=1 Tax=Cohnella cellulosilytica TaxID=986710 RepID=A0ABW2FHR3_9BACL
MADLIAGGVRYPIRAILFDKDGTLLDFMYTWGRWSERMLARFSSGLRERELPPLPEEARSWLGALTGADGSIADYDRNGPLAMGTVGELQTILAWHGYRLGLSWAEAKVLADECRREADADLERIRPVKALPHALDFVRRCREAGLSLAVVTADETVSAVRQLEWLGIRDRFAACIGTDRVERGKPYADMVELACRELGVSCAEVAVIGDTNGDMRMAKAAGAAVAIGIAEPGCSGAARLSDADAVVSSYRELAIEEQE